MSNNAIKKAWEHFLKKTHKVYVERCTKIESFEEYLSHRYRDNCYYYSAYALMGLEPQDRLVRGVIDLKYYKNYRHGWVEFTFENEEYVFDSRLEYVVPKQEYYNHFNPRIDYKKSQEEILKEFLNERCATKITEGFWQFKYFAMNADTETISYSQAIEIDRNNGFVPGALMLARLQLNKFNGTITRFIAYVEPSG